MAGRMGGEKVTTLNLEVVAGRRRARPAARARAPCPVPKGGARARPRRRQGRGEGSHGHGRPCAHPPAQTAGTVELDDAIFGIEPNVPVMHQVVTAQLAARRAGTQSTKTRAEVRGGGAKPWSQKGTGRARAGLDPRAAVARRWRGPRPEAAQLRAAHPQEDDPPGAALGAVRPGRRGQGRRRRRAGASTAPKTKRREGRARRRSASRAGSLVVLDRRRRERRR